MRRVREVFWPAFFRNNFFRGQWGYLFCPVGAGVFWQEILFGKFFVRGWEVFQHLKRYFYIYPLMFIELTPPKYLKQYLPHTQRPTILTHLLKQTRQTTTTQTNNIITLPILILKTHRNTINKLRETILITQNPIHQR